MTAEVEMMNGKRRSTEPTFGVYMILGQLVQMKGKDRHD
jgi:hypothetical protein